MWQRRCVLASFCAIAASSSTQECQSNGKGTCQSNQGSMMASLIAEDAVGRVTDEQNNLLQRHVDSKETSMSLPPTSNGDVKKAIAWEGGGFLSLADFSGVVAGLMAAIPERGYGKMEKSIEQLFGKFGILSGISGGTWFMTQLVHSRKFLKLMERSASFPNLAEAAWAVEYYAAVLNPIGHTTLGAQARGMAECIWKARNVFFLQQNVTKSEALLQSDQEMLPFSPNYLPWYLQVLAEMSILIQTGAVSWIDLVGDALYFRGSGISPTKGLGTKTANAWAKGKVEIIGTTIVTPPGSDKFSGTTANLTEVALFAEKNGKQNFAYQTALPDKYHPKPVIVPARFSAIVGAGENQKAPVSFCAKPDCFGLTSTYTGTVRGQKEFEQTINLQDVYSSAFEKSGGKVPIAGASAASSAFKGLSAIQGGLPQKQGCLSLAVWTTDKANGKSFQEGYDMRNSIFKWDSISSKQAEKIATAGLQPLVDGGPTDFTGIGHAVALEATDIVSMLDTGVGSMGIDSLLTQFEGGGNPEREIFQSPAAEVMLAKYNSFTRIRGIEGSEFLDELRFGSVPCVTKANKWFGVKGGRNVNVNFIAIVSKNITIGLIEEPYSYNSFFNYAKLTGEIVRTMTQKDNQDKVGEMLDFFL